MKRVVWAVASIALLGGLVGVTGDDRADAFAVVNGPTLASGSIHSLTLRSDGTVWAFGSNTFGQLGSTTSNPNPTTTQVPGLTNVTAISAGDAHSLALRSDGTVWGFGYNSYGQLGTTTNNGTGSPNPTPTKVPGLTNVTAISAGTYHSLALRSDGTVWAFGYNYNGQLGATTNNGTVNPNPTPTKVPGLTNVTAISASLNHSLALRSDGTVWGFGENTHGQLGTTTNNGTGTPNPTPTKVPGLTNVTAISAGEVHSLVLRSDGTVWAFGRNYQGQLGISTNSGNGNSNPTPTKVPGLTGVTAISASGSNSLVLRSDGTVWAFGDNYYGQLGTIVNNSTSYPNPTPTQVPGLTNVTAIRTGGNILGGGQALALRSDGTVWAFGNNRYGQLGSTTNNGTPNPNPTATKIPDTVAALALMASRFTPVSPTRIFDTRPAAAVNYTGPEPGAGSSTKVQIVGKAGIPANATAVTANLTIVGALGAGFVQAFPTGLATAGSSSNLNVERAGQTIANAITVPVGVDGTITLFNQSGGHLLVDVTGYYTPAPGPVSDGRLIPVTPTRMLDTRATSQIGYAGPKPPPGSITRVQVTGRAPVPVADVQAVVLNVTATNAAAAGFLQVGPAGLLIPGASSNINLETAGQTIPNQVVVPVGAGGGIEIYTQSGADVLVDITAYITAGTATAGTDGLFVPITPTRALDTRPGSTVGYPAGTKPGPSGTVRVDASSLVPTAMAAAVAANLTITQTTNAGFVQHSAAGSLIPGASSTLNAERANQTIANAALIPVANSRFDIYTETGTHLLADITGWYTN